jgi:hypothetical protein
MGEAPLLQNYEVKFRISATKNCSIALGILRRLFLFRLEVVRQFMGSQFEV